MFSLDSWFAQTDPAGKQALGWGRNKKDWWDNQARDLIVIAANKGRATEQLQVHIPRVLFRRSLWITFLFFEETLVRRLIGSGSYYTYRTEAHEDTSVRNKRSQNPSSDPCF